MKKTIMAVSVAMASTFAMAGEYVNLDFAPNMVAKNGVNSAYMGGLAIGSNYGPLFVEGALITERQKQVGKAMSTEAKIVGGMNIGDVTFRGGIGEQFTSNKNFGIYTYGAVYKYTGFKIINIIAQADNTVAFDKNNGEFTTWKLGADYPLTKRDSIGINYVNRTGDIKDQGLQMTYGHSF